MDGAGYFITGANGQLGTALRQKYPKASYADIDLLDITDTKSVAEFDWSGVEVLINAAAYTNVDGAEGQEGRRTAWSVNSSAVANLAEIARDNKITLVHVSTDYVFDGSNNNHDEDEPFSPLSVYGASKAAGDIAAGLAPKHYILRTSWVIGEGKNFVRTMVGLAEKNVSPKVVNDQIGRLTFTKTLVGAIDHLLQTKAEFGVYNVSNAGDPASWADITRAIFAELGRDDLSVSNTTTEEYYAGKSGIAPRPLQSTLDLAKIKTAGFNPSAWQEELKSYLRQRVNL
ncbi:NAD(P)-dependent oxidoreductase [Candidatus Parcubacteria bacterium]|nr:NAD(P)-dependent oxidoreductase [Candidatus Parcubacteria bacterium]